MTPEKVGPIDDAWERERERAATAYSTLAGVAREIGKGLARFGDHDAAWFRETATRLDAYAGALRPGTAVTPDLPDDPRHLRLVRR